MLVNLDRSVNCLIEPEARSQSHESRHQKQSQRRQSHVSKVEHVRGKRVRLQLLKVHKRVEEDVYPRGPSRAERTPPPVVVLSTKLKVVEEDGNLCRRDDEDGEHPM